MKKSQAKVEDVKLTKKSKLKFFSASFFTCLYLTFTFTEFKFYQKTKAQRDEN